MKQKFIEKRENRQFNNNSCKHHYSAYNKRETSQAEDQLGGRKLDSQYKTMTSDT